MMTRTLGDLSVSAIGLGGMPLSRPGRDGSLPDRERAIATVRAALDLGVTLVDTADCYGPDDHPDDEGLGHNEELVAVALRGRSEEVLVATKGGIRRRGAEWPIDGRPGSGRRWRGRCVGSASTASASTSTTGPTRTSPTPRRWVR